jgi:hypothetical protein
VEASAQVAGGVAGMEFVRELGVCHLAEESMTESQIEQAMSIEAAQRKIQAQIVSIAHSIAFYRRYPRLYATAIKDLCEQRDRFVEQYKRLGAQLVGIWQT